MRRVPATIITAAASAVCSCSSSSTQTQSTTSTSNTTNTNARHISIFGWKPYRNQDEILKAEKEAEEAREAEKRFGSHVYKARDGTIDEDMLKDMYERGGPVELLGDDIPVRNLPRPNLDDVNAPQDWSKLGSPTVGNSGDELVPTGTSSSSPSEEIATIDRNNNEGAVESFDIYKKSTLAYMSNVNPDTLVGVGLGAGFGEVEDSRLGFLRPSKKANALRTPAEEEAWIREQKSKGLMDPEEGDAFLDGTVYRPSKQGVRGLTLLGGTRQEAFAATDKRQQEKYDAIDKAMREGNYEKALSRTDVEKAMEKIVDDQNQAAQSGGMAVYNAERAYALAKTEEEKKAIRDRQRRLAQLQLAAALKRMSDWRGTTFSAKEHFLLADLDYDRDSLLFGRTREEFEENVKKMKSVVVGYANWERRDHWYKYGTWFAKFAAAAMVYEIYETTKARNMLINYYDDFTNVIAETIEQLEAKRCEDIAKAAAELGLRPPDFAPLKAAIEKERKRLRAERAAQIREEELAEELQRREEELARKRAADAVAMFGGLVDDDETRRLRSEAAKAAAAVAALAPSPDARAATLVTAAAPTGGGIKRHPMDTTGVEYEKNLKEMEGLKDALFKSDDLVSKVRTVSPVDAGIDSSTPFVTSSTASTSSQGGASSGTQDKMIAAAEFFHKYLVFGGLRGFFATDHRVSNTGSGSSARSPKDSKTAVSSASADGVEQITAVANAVAGANNSTSSTPAAAVPKKKKRLQPLTKAEEDELILSSLAYSVSPTSVDAVKQLRRTLLPRSEDFTMIVRQQMLDYRASKKGVTVYPGSDKAEAN